MPVAPDRFVPPAPYPGTKDLPPLTRLRRMFGSQIDGLPRAVYTQDLWAPKLPGMPVFVMSPALVGTVLLDRAADFPHGDLFARIMRPAWGQGMLLAEGDDWRRQRRAAAEAFRAGGMAAFAPFFAEATNTLVADWSARGAGTVNLKDEMRRLTFNIIVDTMLSGAGEVDREPFRASVSAFFDDISKLRASYLLRGDAWHASRPSPQSPHRSAVAAHISALIDARRQAPPRGDLVDLLIAASDPETGQGLSDAQLADNLLGFILAGFETTAAALTWALYLIASDRPVEQKILTECDAVLGTNLPAPQTVNHLTYTRQVVSEALRIYPPAFMITRIAARETTLAGRRMKAGQRINIPIWAIHRAERFWPNSHAFDPERFAPGAPQPDRYTYMPFGAGPRICIGAAFAMTEMVTVIAALLPRIAIDPQPRSAVWPETDLALNVKGGLQVTLRQRG